MSDSVKEAAATYEALLDLPDNVVGEIVAGELHVSPRPAARHVAAASVLGGEINIAFHRGRGGPGGWWILAEPELHLAADVLVPDLAGWRRERMASIPDVTSFDLAPDWICEVISPSTARLDRTRKLRSYAEQGVAHLWLVEPSAKTLEVFELIDRRWTLLATHGGEEKVRAVPFEAIEIDLSALWID